MININRQLSVVNRFMQITIKFFAQLRDVVGSKTIQQSISPNTTVHSLREVLQTQYPGLKTMIRYAIIAVNHEFATLDAILDDGDEVAFFPPVSGGSDDKLTITQDPISLDAVAAKVIKPNTGAVAVFGGVVRNVSAGKDVTCLEYEAYEAMALKKLEQVAQEARQQWPDIIDIAIVQRIGQLDVGEKAVAVAVSSMHRGDGCFEACRFAIDRLKQIVPIWKKEVSPDGSTWVEGDYHPTTTDMSQK